MSDFFNGDGGYDILGNICPLRIVIGNIAKSAVLDGKWFSICKGISDKQYDIMKYMGTEGNTLGSIVREQFPETSYRSAIYKTMLRDYLCYVEVPIIHRNVGGTEPKNAFNKFLATSNIYVVAEWLRITQEEVFEKYGRRVFDCDDDNESDMYPYLKLHETKEGVRKVTIPRADIDLSKRGTRVIPVFALKDGIDLVYEMASDEVVKVSFIKDNGEERDIFTTFNDEIIHGIYGTCDFYISGIAGQYSGNFLLNDYLTRGYIRVVEVGGSKHDSPLRAINYARIVGISEDEEPDLSCINIDLSEVLDEFINSVRKLRDSDIDEFINMLDVFDVGASREVYNHKLRTQLDIEEWVNAQYLLLSTVFTRQLAIFMLGNPKWFSKIPGLTGSFDEDSTASTMGNDGEENDFAFNDSYSDDGDILDDGFDLDFSL